MPDHRSHTALGVHAPPQIATDPDRNQERLREFLRRLACIRLSYLLAIEALGGDQAFNQSFARLKRSLARKRLPKVRGDRAHPELETAISVFARKFAAERTGVVGAQVTQVDANAGAQKAAEALSPRRGRSRKDILRHHVEGTMALLQEAGMRVGLTLEKNYCYEPQAVNTGGRILVHMFQDLDPTIAVSTLASMVKGARCKYAGKPMRFGDFFPLYGMGAMREDGTADLRFGYRLERFEPNIPIYFP